MNRYKVWIQIEQIDENNDIYKNISEPCEAGVFPEKTDALRFIKEELLLAHSHRLKLKQLGHTGLNLITYFNVSGNSSAYKCKQDYEQLLKTAAATEITNFDDRCPRCGNHANKRLLINEQLIGKDLITVHYCCLACNNVVGEDFVRSAVYIE